MSSSFILRTIILVSLTPLEWIKTRSEILTHLPEVTKLVNGGVPTRAPIQTGWRETAVKVTVPNVGGCDRSPQTAAGRSRGGDGPHVRLQGRWSRPPPPPLAGRLAPVSPPPPSGRRPGWGPQ